MTSRFTSTGGHTGVHPIFVYTLLCSRYSYTDQTSIDDKIMVNLCAIVGWGTEVIGIAQNHFIGCQQLFHFKETLYLIY